MFHYGRSAQKYRLTLAVRYLRKPPRQVSAHSSSLYLSAPTRAIMTMLRLSLGGGQSLRQGSALFHRLQSSHYAPSSTAAHHFAVRRSFADDAKTDPPKGTPYSKLTVGVPKETFPLEKRVAATPDVSLWMFLAFVLQLSLRNTNTSLSCRHVRIYLFICMLPMPAVATPSVSFVFLFI